VEDGVPVMEGAVVVHEDGCYFRHNLSRFYIDFD
jgi:hypothetical protein